MEANILVKSQQGQVDSKKKTPCVSRWAWVMGSFISRRLKGLMQPPQIVILLIKDINNTISSVYLPMTKHLTAIKLDVAG